MEHKSVIIIGGGMSGIKTAIDLFHGGVEDTLILEARSRLGGRILSKESPSNNGVVYDLGASWFHDGLKNPLFEKSKKLGNIDYYFDDGKSAFYSATEDGIVESWKFDAVVDEFYTYSALTYESDPDKQDMSIKDMWKEYSSQFNDRLNENQRKHAPAVIRMWTELWLGESWDQLSAKLSLERNSMHHLGRNIFIKSGYTKVLENELNELPKSYRKASIKLEAQVKKIDFSDPKRIKLQLSNGGKEYSCDYLVVTVPQTVLAITEKDDPQYIEWTPKVPTPISELIKDLKFSSLGKVVLEFDECFWPKDFDRFYALTTNVPKIDINDKGCSETIIEAWDFPALFLNFQAIHNVPALVILTQRPLSGYIEELLQRGHSDKVWHIYKPILEKIAKNSQIPAPTNILCSPWNGEKYSRGSYGTSLVGAEDSAAIVEKFQQGFQNRIRFAGTETMGDTSSGCVHGAWYSGQREAKAILKSMSSGEKEVLAESR